MYSFHSSSRFWNASIVWKVERMKVEKRRDEKRKTWMPTHRRMVTLPANATVAYVTWIFINIKSEPSNSLHRTAIPSLLFFLLLYSSVLSHFPSFFFATDAHVIHQPILKFMKLKNFRSLKVGEQTTVYQCRFAIQIQKRNTYLYTITVCTDQIKLMQTLSFLAAFLWRERDHSYPTIWFN